MPDNQIYSSTSFQATLDAVRCVIPDDELAEDYETIITALLDVAEAAQRLASRDGHANDYCTDCELGGHVAPCPWIALDAALEKLPQKSDGSEL
jgi:hypothetical protein